MFQVTYANNDLALYFRKEPPVNWLAEQERFHPESREDWSSGLREKSEWEGASVAEGTFQKSQAWWSHVGEVVLSCWQGGFFRKMETKRVGKVSWDQTALPWNGGRRYFKPHPTEWQQKWWGSNSPVRTESQKDSSGYLTSYSENICIRILLKI